MTASVRTGCEHTFVSRAPGYTREEAAEAVAHARSFSEALRLLGVRAAGGHHRTLKAALIRWVSPPTTSTRMPVGFASELRSHARHALRPEFEAAQHATMRGLRRRLSSAHGA